MDRSRARRRPRWGGWLYGLFAAAFLAVSGWVGVQDINAAPAKTPTTPQPNTTTDTGQQAQSPSPDNTVMVLLVPSDGSKPTVRAIPRDVLSQALGSRLPSTQPQPQPRTSSGLFGHLRTRPS